MWTTESPRQKSFELGNGMLDHTQQSSQITAVKRGDGTNVMCR